MKKVKADAFIASLEHIDRQIIKLAGLSSASKYECLARQLVDSQRRVEFVFSVRDGQHDIRRSDPSSALFDPLKAAVLRHRKGEVEEAFWLVFIATHFGKHHIDGWMLAATVYGKLGEAGQWDWPSISNDTAGFSRWLANNQYRLQQYRFSNHRKYESVRANTDNGTAKVFESYVDWVNKCGGHESMIRDIHLKVGQNPKTVFAELYKSMNVVKRFGRLGRFDFLTMLGKLGIAPIKPDSAYLWHNATGPKKGARLLFGNSPDAKLSPKQLDGYLQLIDGHLNVGMQVLEDALCNWQKSPDDYKLFKG